MESRARISIIWQVAGNKYVVEEIINICTFYTYISRYNYDKIILHLSQAYR